MVGDCLTAAYNFRVAAASYYINGVARTSAEQMVTLGAAHATLLDRIDVIAVTDAGAVIVVPGTAASQPSEPDVDPATQLKLGVVLVSAATVAPVGASVTNLWSRPVNPLSGIDRQRIRIYDWQFVQSPDRHEVVGSARTSRRIRIYRRHWEPERLSSPITTIRWCYMSSPRLCGRLIGH
jgi:hypothetical protein